MRRLLLAGVILGGAFAVPDVIHATNFIFVGFSIA
jgi:hypothetical protein